MTLQSFCRYLYLIKDEIRQAQSNEEYYFGNPVNSHLFIKHLTADWYKIEEILPQGNIHPLVNQYRSIISLDFLQTLGDHWLFPSFEDYTGKSNPIATIPSTMAFSSNRFCDRINAFTGYL